MGFEPSAAYGRPYPGSMVAAGILGSIFFPLISLIVALVLLGQERDLAKRAALRTWAWISGGVMALQLVLVVIVLAAVGSAGSGVGDVDESGPCQGGPQMGSSGVVQPDGTAVLPCEFGGSVTIGPR